MANAEIMSKRIGATMLELVQGDITTLAVDAIVNAANKFLAHGGGVALAIARKGGSAITVESETIIAQRGPLTTGDAVITTGGKLPARYVIHTVGPVWGEGSENDKLRRAIRHSLTLADKESLKTIAFPAISTGIYRFPIDQAAKLMLTETAHYLRGQTALDRVIFCLYDDPTFCEFEKAFLAL